MRPVASPSNGACLWKFIFSNIQERSPSGLIAEKPSVEKEFALALNCNQNHKGYYTNSDNSKIITDCVSHLLSLAPPEYYTSDKSWNLDNLPIIPGTFMYTANTSALQQTHIIIKLLKENSNKEIIIATDAGREGELIARIVLTEAQIFDISNIKRFWVSEALTKNVILSGIQTANALQNYNEIAAQGYARQHADWLVGMNFTQVNLAF